MGDTIIWIGIRLCFSAAGIYTIQRVCEAEGHSIGLGNLIIISVVTVVGVRLWMPSQRSE